MEELKAMFKVCRHIKTNGIRCGSPAITGMNFCFNHFTGKPMAFVRASTTTTYETNLAFLHPGTREAIQHNLALVAQALNEGKIDTQTANAYTRLYRVAEQNLTRWEKAHKNNPEKQMLPLSSEEEDVILNEAQRSEGPAVSGLVSGHDFSHAETRPQNSRASAPEAGLDPADLAYNQAMAAQHAARMGRPLNPMERKYFGLPPAPPDQAPLSRPAF